MMTFENHQNYTIVRAQEVVISDVSSALELLMNADYQAGCKNIVVDKALICEDFFLLSTRLAGEILQKFVNYGGRLSIYGDFTRYDSKALHDFIYESNKGKTVFFSAGEEEAVKRLIAVL